MGVGDIVSFCSLSYTANTDGQTQIIEGISCAVSTDCSNCRCITFENTDTNKHTIDYIDCDGNLNSDIQIQAGEILQFCGSGFTTSDKLVVVTVGGICGDGVTCPVEITPESIILFSDSVGDAFLYNHSANTLTQLFLPNAYVSNDIGRNSNYLWIYESPGGGQTSFRQYDISTLNPSASAWTYSDYVISADTGLGLTSYNSSDTVFAVSGDGNTILRYTMSTGSVIVADNVGTGVEVKDWIYNSSTGVLIIAGIKDGDYGIFQWDGVLTTYLNNSTVEVVALYQYGSQLFYIDDKNDVYQIDTTSPYTTTFIQSMPTVEIFVGSAQDDTSAITVYFT